eukprot:gene4727-9388_t
MDHIVHRWRYPDWIPSPIRSIASDPFSSKVALGREDGDIEIACSSSKWHTLARIYGQEDFKLQSLVWSTVEEGRLFGISLNGFIFEVDLKGLLLKNIQDSCGGSAWCLAPSPRSPILAIGCEDGTCRIFTYDNNNLQYFRAVPTAGSRILCVAFHPKLPRIVMGCTDGTIRCVDENTSRSLFRMTGDILRGVPTRIWSLVVLSDSTIVTGDSRGHVQFWDGQVGVLIATIQQHTAEVLALAVSPDETSIFASGTDSRVTCMRKVSIPHSELVNNNTNEHSHSHSPADNQWVHTTAQRPHSHDVYTLAIISNNYNYKQKDGKTSTTTSSTSNDNQGRLLSGGLDCKLCVYSLEGFGQLRPSWILPIPARGLVHTILNDHCSGWSLVRHRRRIDLWKLNGNIPSKLIRKNNDDNNDDDVDVIGTVEDNTDNEDKDIINNTNDVASTKCELILRLESPSDLHHISCTSMAKRNSNSNHKGIESDIIIAASRNSGTKLWLLQHATSTSSTSKLIVKKLELPKVANTSCTAMCFSEDGRLLVLATKLGTILLLDIATKVVDDDEDGSSSITDVNIRHVIPHRDMIASMRNTTSRNTTATSSSSITGNTSGIESLSMLSSGENSSGGGGYEVLEDAIVQLSLSSDGLWLGVADGSCRGRVYVYDLDRFRLHWAVPRNISPITDIQFHPTSSTSLIVIFANNTFLLQDLSTRRLCPWSETIPPHSMPDVLRKCPGPLQGVCFCPDSSNTMILYGQGYFVYVDLDMPIPNKPKVIAATTTSTSTSSSNMMLSNNKHMDDNNMQIQNMTGKKRRKKEKAMKELNEASPNFAMVHRYRGLVHVSYLSGGQLVMVENPWLGVLSQLPDTLARKRYGT